MPPDAQSPAKVPWTYDLYLMSQTVLSQEDPVQVQQRLMEYLISRLDADSCMIALTDLILYDQLAIVGGVNMPVEKVGGSLYLGEGLAGRVAQSGEVQRDAGSASTGPSICWPLKAKQLLMGVISMERVAGSPPFTAEDMDHGGELVNLMTLVIENTRLYTEQQNQINALSMMNEQISAINHRLEDAQNQLLQSEKMASIGQLAAGVAHEINNPIGFVYSNLNSLEKYLQDLLAVLGAYEHGESALQPAALAAILKVKQRVDLEFLREDIAALMSESRDGITRVKKIVQDLKDFSHVGAADEWQWADLHAGIDSTLNIVINEIKYKAQVVKEYATLPEVECLPSQLNQVIMNILVNGAHAIEGQGVITIRTGLEGRSVWIEIADTGKGIPAENLKRVFDPFFTTKPVGKGTGLGLSLSYSIIQKHHGKIEVKSKVGAGTTFRVTLPVSRNDVLPEANKMAEVAA